jgi:hypothetical protein
MNAIRATWINGQIVPSEPANWPEGSELLVEATGAKGDKIGLTEDEWRDDPESVAAWIEAVQAIEPPIWAEGEAEEYERYRAEHRRFNIDAVRKQMEETSGGEAP